MVRSVWRRRCCQNIHIFFTKHSSHTLLITTRDRDRRERRKIRFYFLRATRAYSVSIFLIFLPFWMKIFWSKYTREETNLTEFTFLQGIKTKPIDFWMNQIFSTKYRRRKNWEKNLLHANAVQLHAIHPTQQTRHPYSWDDGTFSAPIVDCNAPYWWVQRHRFLLVASVFCNGQLFRLRWDKHNSKATSPTPDSNVVICIEYLNTITIASFWIANSYRNSLRSLFWLSTEWPCQIWSTMTLASSSWMMNAYEEIAFRFLSSRRTVRRIFR